MDELNQNQNSVPPAMPPTPQMQPKSKFWKFAVWFVVVVVVTAVGLWVLGDYQWKKGIEEFEKWVESTKQAAADFEARKAADTYGGATPQETLRFYIEAVERGDYELASKYFVLDMQEQAMSGFGGATQENLLGYLEVLRRVLTNEGSYSSTRDTYVIDEPVLIEFKLYPSGVWKIIEI